MRVDWEAVLLKTIVTVLTIAAMVAEAAANDWQPSFGLGLLAAAVILGAWLAVPKRRRK